MNPHHIILNIELDDDYFVRIEADILIADDETVEEAITAACDAFFDMLTEPL